MSGTKAAGVKQKGTRGDERKDQVVERGWEIAVKTKIGRSWWNSHAAWQEGQEVTFRRWFRQGNGCVQMLQKPEEREKIALVTR